MKRCAFLTLADPAGYFIDDNLAYEPLRALGWHAEAVVWNEPRASWGEFDAVVIRSPWDYQNDPDTFFDVLWTIENTGVPLFNDLDVVRWNLRKTYLRDLEARGVPIVPTLWRDRLGPGELMDVFEEVGTDEAVLKPVVSANADGAFRLNRRTARERSGEVEAYYSDRALMAQPFLHAVLSEGEYSLFYFNGEFSHCILKTPKAADFRVQEEHGGHIQAVKADATLLAQGEMALRSFGEPPLYARVDFVRANDGSGFWLMELELIEPALYFRMDPESPGRFARAFVNRLIA